MSILNYLVLAIFILGVFSQSHIDARNIDETPVQVCGPPLARLVQAVCNSQYVRFSYKRDLEGETPLNFLQRSMTEDGMFRRQIHDECCKQTCTIGHVRKYYCRLDRRNEMVSEEMADI